MHYVLMYAEHTESRWKELPGVLQGSMYQKKMSSEEMRPGEKLGSECSEKTK